jgi:hypothetical protein
MKLVQFISKLVLSLILLTFLLKNLFRHDDYLLNLTGKIWTQRELNVAYPGARKYRESFQSRSASSPFTHIDSLDYTSIVRPSLPLGGIFIGSATLDHIVKTMISSRFQEVARSCGKTVPCGATVVGAHLQAISSLAVSSRRAGPLSMPSRSSFESLGVKVEIQQSHLDLKDDVEREKSTVFDTSYGRHPRVPFRRIHSPPTTKPINATQDTSKLFLSDSDRGNAFYFMPQLREQRRRNSPSNYVLPISSTFSCYCPTKLRQQSFLTLNPQRSIYLLENLPQKRCFTASKDYKTRGDSSSLDKSTNCTTPLHRKRDESTGGLPPIQEIVDSTVETVRPIVESAEMNLRKAVDIVRLQDLGTLYGVVLLVFLVVTTPFVARYVNSSSSEASIVRTQD